MTAQQEWQILEPVIFGFGYGVPTPMPGQASYLCDMIKCHIDICYYHGDVNL